MEKYTLRYMPQINILRVKKKRKEKSTTSNREPMSIYGKIIPPLLTQEKFHRGTARDKNKQISFYPFLFTNGSISSHSLSRFLLDWTL